MSFGLAPALMPAENSVIDPRRRIDAPDLVGGPFREPQIAVGACRDAAQAGVGRDAGAEFRDVPVGVIRPIRLAVLSVNHRLPSGPADDRDTECAGADASAELRDRADGAIGRNRDDPANPVAVALDEPDDCCRDRAPMPPGFAPALRPTLNSVTTPAGVMRPIRLPVCSVNQMLPSGPRVVPRGDGAGGIPALNSVKSCAWAGAATSCSTTSAAKHTVAHAPYRSATGTGLIVDRRGFRNNGARVHAGFPLCKARRARRAPNGESLPQAVLSRDHAPRPRPRVYFAGNHSRFRLRVNHFSTRSMRPARGGTGTPATASEEAGGGCLGEDRATAMPKMKSGRVGGR